MIAVRLSLLALLGCVWFCAFEVQAYLRHVDSGDHTGFAMGLGFLLGLCIPAIGTLLTIGVMRLSKAGPRALERWAIAVLLVAGALAILAFARFVLKYEVLPSFLRQGPVGWHRLPIIVTSALELRTLVGFSAYLLACAAAVGAGRVPTSQGGRLAFGGVLLATTGVAMLQIMTFAGLGLGGLIAGIPSMIWIVTLLVALGRLFRGDDHDTPTATAAP